MDHQVLSGSGLHERPGTLSGSPGSNWQQALLEAEDPALAPQPHTQDGARLLQGEQRAQLNPASHRAAGSNSTGRESRKEAQARSATGEHRQGVQAGKGMQATVLAAAAAYLGENQGKPWVHAVTQDLAASQAPDGVTVPGVCSLVCAELAGSCSAAARWDPVPGGDTAGSAQSNLFG